MARREEGAAPPKPLELHKHLANGRIGLTDIGRIVADAWRWLPSQYAYVVLDEWCLMPDHLHGILRLVEPCGGLQ